MAFCKFCGKEIPEGGVCDCAAAQGQNAANNTFDQANNVFNNDNNNGSKKGIDVNDTINKVKGNPTLLIGGVAVVIVLILLLVFILGHTGAKGAAKSFAKSITKKGKEGLEEIANMMEEKGLSRDARLFYIQMLCSDYKKTIQPGLYILSTDMTAEEILSIIGQVNEETKKADSDDSGQSSSKDPSNIGK